MCKYWNLNLWHFFAHLQYLNYLLTQFLGLDDFKKIPQEDLNGILIHYVLHVWYKQVMMLSFGFTIQSLRSALELFEYVEDTEAIYEGDKATSLKIQPRSDSNCASGGNQNRGEYASPTVLSKIRTYKQKSSYADISNRPQPDSPSCMSACS